MKMSIITQIDHTVFKYTHTHIRRTAIKPVVIPSFFVNTYLGVIAQQHQIQVGGWSQL